MRWFRSTRSRLDQLSANVYTDLLAINEKLEDDIETLVKMHQDDVAQLEDRITNLAVLRGKGVQDAFALIREARAEITAERQVRQRQFEARMKWEKALEERLDRELQCEAPDCGPPLEIPNHHKMRNSELIRTLAEHFPEKSQMRYQLDDIAEELETLS